MRPFFARCWDGIIQLATHLDNKLGPSNGGLRELTQEIVDTVFQELIPPLVLDD